MIAQDLILQRLRFVTEVGVYGRVFDGCAHLTGGLTCWNRGSGGLMRRGAIAIARTTFVGVPAGR